MVTNDRIEELQKWIMASRLQAEKMIGLGTRR